jgi:Xaa-Pro aminopeptidase
MSESVFAPTVYQTFDIKTDKKTVAPRLKALRGAIAEAGLDGFLVPRADAHRGESVPPGEARLAYVTSFTGSAGIASIGLRKATLFVDSRYTLQAPAETNTSLIRVVEATQGGLPKGVGDVVPKGGKLGYDPWLHTPGEIKDLAAKLEGHATLVATGNLVDRIWTDRPGTPVTLVEFLGHNRAGKTANEKLADLQRTLVEEHVDATVLTLPESICWLFNMRGRDVPNTPFVLGFAIVPKKGKPTLYLDKKKINAEVKKGLEGVASVADARTMMAALRRLGAADKRVLLDPATAPIAIFDAIKGVSDAVIVEKRDPVLLPKAIKNDAVAMAKFLCWFDAEAPKGKLDEIGIVTALEAFRRESDALADVSFNTISGAGPNGAIVHYRVDGKTNRGLKPGELMLLDSGGQYLMGTTDITRTMATGKVTAEQKDRFTRVLKGMIAISMARFPKGTSGAQIDILARQFLWQAGITYNHGTGHGVGHFLSVHEGPAGISSRYPTPLEAGMILSNEPGYYKEGAYGIRIENLVLIVESAQYPGYLEFETLTLTPIDLRLVDEKLLVDAECDWLNAYHKRVFKEIGPLVKGEVKAWLKDATRAI